MNRKLLYGFLAAVCATLVALDATVGMPHNYPIFHKVADGEYLILRNFTLSLFTLGAAGFGFLAANVKNGVNGKQ